MCFRPRPPASAPRPPRESLMRRITRRVLPRREQQVQEWPRAQPSSSASASASHVNAEPNLTLGNLLGVLSDLIQRQEIGAAMHLMENLMNSPLALVELPCTQEDFQGQLEGFLDEHTRAVSRSVLRRMVDVLNEQSQEEERTTCSSGDGIYQSGGPSDWRSNSTTSPRPTGAARRNSTSSPRPVASARSRSTASPRPTGAARSNSTASPRPVAAVRRATGGDSRTSRTSAREASFSCLFSDPGPDSVAAGARHQRGSPEGRLTYSSGSEDDRPSCSNGAHPGARRRRCNGDRRPTRGSGDHLEDRLTEDSQARRRRYRRARNQDGRRSRSCSGSQESRRTCSSSQEERRTRSSRCSQDPRQMCSCGRSRRARSGGEECSFQLSELLRSAHIALLEGAGARRQASSSSSSRSSSPESEFEVHGGIQVCWDPYVDTPYPQPARFPPPSDLWPAARNEVNGQTLTKERQTSAEGAATIQAADDRPTILQSGASSPAARMSTREEEHERRPRVLPKL